MRLCDNVHVLDERKTITEGLPNDVRHNSAAINSYPGNSKNIVKVHSKMLHSKQLAYWIINGNKIMMDRLTKNRSIILLIKGSIL